MFSIKNTSAGTNIRFMGSTFWAESYFRSLKKARVLTVLTKYLIRYKRVCIPNVGTFEIVMQPPQLDVGGQRIAPPVFVTTHRPDDKVPDHQYRFFINEERETDSFRQELFSFGEKLKRHIQASPFHWKGLGTLRYASNELLFEPDEIRVDALQPLTAQKVLRQNVQHSMLVGDQEMTSQQVSEALSHVEYKRPWFIIAGWILLIIAALAILIFLYLKNFQPTSTGLQTTW
jgi:hypothetical protein